MRTRATVVAAGAAAAIVAVSAGPASAWDCIRVSGSQAGLQHSTASGNWAYATIDDIVGGAVQDGIITGAQAPCVLAAWTASGEPSYFAMGTGVAGARGAEQSGRISNADFFELAKNAPVKAVTDGHGVDHLLDALMYYAGECLSD
ncbi:MAG TPA: hypothetical protein VHO29_14385 [Marmoricola sp.]|nr:hypothetical protein [Marmoricola sp.]